MRKKKGERERERADIIREERQRERKIDVLVVPDCVTRGGVGKVEAIRESRDGVVT